jgi:hypothetical protein
MSLVGDTFRCRAQALESEMPGGVKSTAAGWEARVQPCIRWNGDKRKRWLVLTGPEKGTRMINNLFGLRILAQLTAMALSLISVAFITSCGESQANNKVVATSISCKNESPLELWDARVVVGERSFGLGYIDLGKKKTMVVGSLDPKNIVVYYSFCPADNDPESIVEKIVELPGEKIAGVAAQAGEVEVVCKGDGKWTVRVYERTADHKGRVILQSDMDVAKKQP